jgi:hypothetical protein
MLELVEKALKLNHIPLIHLNGAAASSGQKKAKLISQFKTDPDYKALLLYVVSFLLCFSLDLVLFLSLLLSFYQIFA